jgi:enamine deaminase RidA (YjgF/YER057c/UK114 family)
LESFLFDINLISCGCLGFQGARDIRLKHWNRERQPASTMVQVGILTRDGALYEVEATAMLPPV